MAVDLTTTAPAANPHLSTFAGQDIRILERTITAAMMKALCTPSAALYQRFSSG